MTAPTTFVLFGATGDLAKRKLDPRPAAPVPVAARRRHARRGDLPRRDVRRRASATWRWSPSASTAPARWGMPTGTSSPSASTSCRSRPARWPWARPSTGPRSCCPATSTSACTTCRCRRRPRSPRCAPSLEAGLVVRSRVVMEKPFGTDYASAVALNAQLHEVFDEEQIFRIDHFLGKEPAQNILAFRFANGLFEPIWHRNNISHIEIDVPETLGLTQRGDFYEATGAYRDMVVTHLFQILAFTAMEPPTSLEPAAISREKNKVFRSMQPIQPSRRRARPVHRLPRRAGRGARLRDRDLRGAEVLRRQLALGRGAVLPAHRQADGRGRPDHLDRVPRAPAVDVPAGLGRRRQRPRPPHLRPRRQVTDVVVLLRKAARARASASTSCRCSSRCRRRPGPAPCSRPTSG